MFNKEYKTLEIILSFETKLKLLQSFVPADDKSNHVKMIGLMLNRNLKEKLAAQGVKKNEATVSLLL